MRIGKPLREIVVEPLECPVPAAVPDPERSEPEPLAPVQELHPEPVRQPTP